MWRVASVAVVAVPVLFFLDAAFIINLDLPKWYTDATFYFVIPSGVTIYVIARVLLMALPFASLRSLPAEAYRDVNWLGYIIHAG